VFSWGDAVVEIVASALDTTPREVAMTTSEDLTSRASGMAEQQASELLGGDVREGYADIGDQRLSMKITPPRCLRQAALFGAAGHR
jgi:hypothetical protein